MHITSRLPLLVALAAFTVGLEARASPPKDLLAGRQLSGEASHPQSFVLDVHTTPRSVTPPTSTIVIFDARPRPTGSSISIGSKAGASVASQTTSTDLSSTTLTPLWDIGPSIQPDVPITAACLALFLVGVILHGWRCYRINEDTKGRTRPVLSALVLSFCLVRVIACALRIVLATRPRDGTATFLELIFMHIGSVVIFVASLILGQRLLKYFSLTSLLHSSWRLVLFWFSRLLLPMSILSALTIFAVYAAGTSLLANDLSSGVATEASEKAFTLMKIAVSCLFVFGAVPVLLVFLVVATSRIVPRRQDSLAVMLAVFMLGAVMLVAGQGFHLGALFDPQSAGRVAFYVAGLMFELLVVMLYTLANLDMLFAKQRLDSFTHAKSLSRPQSAERGASQMERGEAWDSAGKDAIKVVTDFELSVTKVDTGSSAQSPSTASRMSTRSPRSPERIRGFGEHMSSRPGSRKSPPDPLR